MSNKNLSKFIEYGGLAFLGGTAWYLARKNEDLEKKILLMREDLFNNKGKVELLKKSLRVTHNKYMRLRDNLKEHVEDMINLKKNKGWSKDTEILTDKFPEKDIQFLAPDILVAKLSGLIDAFILNKWSSLSSEYKKVSKSFYKDGKLDINNKEHLIFALSRLRRKGNLKIDDENFILQFHDFYKEKIILKGELPKNYKNNEIEALYDYIIIMILERS